MKKLIIFLIGGLLASSLVWADTIPFEFGITGQISEDGVGLSGDHQITVYLYNDDEEDAVWTEVHESVTFTSGYFYILIGKYESSTFTIDFLTASNPYFLLVVDDDAEQYVELPITSVPYAQYANYALEADSVDWDNITDVPDYITSASYTAGTGLTLTGTEFSISTADVTSGQILVFDGTSWVATENTTSSLGDSISSSDITDGTIGNADIMDGAAIDFDKLNITVDDLENLGFSAEASLTANSIHLSHLSTTFSITTDEVEDGTLTDDDIASTAGISFSKLDIALDDLEISSADTVVFAGVSVNGIISANYYFGDGSNLTGISTAGIDDGSLTTAKFADGAITSAKIAASAIHMDHLSSTFSITSDEIGTGVIELDDLDSDSVSTGKIVDYTITNEDISASAAILFSKLSIATSDLTALGFVTGDITLTEAEIDNLVSDNMFTSANITDSSIGADDLMAGSVGTSEIIDGSVSADDLATGIITDSHIDELTQAAITGLTTSDDVVFAGVSVNGTVSANYFYGDGSNLTGIVATNIGDDAVTSAKIAESAIHVAHLTSTFSITTDEITDGTIAAADLDTGIISDTHINSVSQASITGLTTSDSPEFTGVSANGNVSANYFYGDGSNLTGVVATDIGDDAVTAAKIAENALHMAHLSTTFSITTDELTDGTIAAADLDTGIISDTHINSVSQASITGLTTSDSPEFTGVSANGNVSANYFYGDGSNLTGVVATDIGADAITSAKIAANALHMEHLSTTFSITTDELTDGTIAAADLDTGIISDTHINSVSQASITGLTTSDSPEFTGVSANGNVSANYFYGDGSNLTGVVATDIGADAITSAKIAENALLMEHLSTTFSITTSEITDGTIAAADLDTGIISDTHINSVSQSSITGLTTSDSPEFTGVSANGNVSANYFYGDGSNLTGIVATDIGTAAVVTASISADAVTSAKIADDTITADDVNTDAIGSDELADDAVDTAAIADTAVTAPKIAANALHMSHLSTTFSITTSEITDGTIAAADLDTGIISDTHINSVSQASITGLTTSDSPEFTGVSANGNVSANYFYGDGSNLTGVVATDIGADAITSAKIAANALHMEHLSTTFSITTSEITDGTIAAADLDTGIISDTHINSVSQASITGLTTSDSPEFTGVSANGNVSANYFYGDGSNLTGVVATSIDTGAVVTASIGADAVTSAKIADDTITADDVNTDAIGSDELADDAVDTDAILDDAVTSAKIDDATIAAADLATGIISDTHINSVSQSSITGLTTSDSPEFSGVSVNGQVTANVFTVNEGILFVQSSQTLSNTTGSVDFSSASKHVLTLENNVTLSISANPSGPAALTVIVKQDSTGSRTITWPSAIKWPGGVAPTLTTTASGIDVIGIYYDGTDYLSVATLDFE